ncbi:thiamine ABC transporter substrate-binding protein [Tsukamurella sp. 8F]|uniref:thiamine ABC transporter substrate-binding protein n=1 Tax=unclassified Tsukamurella TaxID=2633480 RepID=UPI0023B896CE|nr:MULTISPECIES: thiamine ABC transporter substrate-binding protein [unclassified Tsukamurella]MDF0530087.1 thiamine ABC transporter substrate-binding protein [Tsukamurella sp. 8J]MDF0586405.1 thiamine ABC transporter substrate-binding protein [Tsukamurella sp. 8F]
MITAFARRAAIAVPAVLAAGALLAGCSTSTAPSSPSASGGAPVTGTVTLVTHDSFHLPDDVLAAFTKQTGLKVDTVEFGDAGTLATKLSLTAGSPPGDVSFGVDNTFASRTLQAGVFQAYASPAAANGASTFGLPGEKRLTAVDYGDVCLNIDTRYFSEKKLPEPRSYDDLVDPKYRGLTVVEDPSTASPGLAFLLGTIATDPNGWQNWWRRLAANDVSVTSDWNTAYSSEFSGSSGKGPRPIVVSYASSPAAEVGKDGSAPATKALLDTCFRQVEYAGVLRGAKNVAGAQKFIDFLLSRQAQAAMPDSMYVYPVTRGVQLPSAWAKYAPVPDKPASLTPQQIADGRDGWLRAWRQALGR